MKKYGWWICFFPKKTFEEARHYRSSKTFHCLASIIGLPIILHLMQDFSLGLNIAAPFLWLMALVLSPFVGLAAIYIFSAVLFVVGKRLKGDANFLDIRTAVAWSNIPMVLSTFTWLLMTLIFGSKLFTLSFISRPFLPEGAGFILVMSLLQLIAVVWSLLLLIRTLSMVQGFSIWRSAINIVIPYLVLFLISLLVR